MMKTLTRQYEELTQSIAKEFYKRYFWNVEDEYSDLDADYYTYCDLVGEYHKTKYSLPGPLCINDGMIVFNINDMRTALEYNIPKSILLTRYDKHQDGYDIDNYLAVNLYNYYRMNHDPEVYVEEQKIERKESEEKLNSSLIEFEKSLGVEGGTLQYLIDESKK